jgi:hypothetical protein
MTVANHTALYRLKFPSRNAGNVILMDATDSCMPALAGVVSALVNQDHQMLHRLAKKKRNLYI